MRATALAPASRTLRIPVVVKVIIVDIYRLETGRIVNPGRICGHLARPGPPHLIVRPVVRCFHGSHVPAGQFVVVDFNSDLVGEPDSFRAAPGSESPCIGRWSRSFKAHTADAHVVAINLEQGVRPVALVRLVWVRRDKEAGTGLEPFAWFSNSPAEQLYPVLDCDWSS